MTECYCGCCSGGCDAPGGCQCGFDCPCQNIEFDNTCNYWICDYCKRETQEPFFDEGDITECPDCYDRNEAKEQYQINGIDYCLCDTCLRIGWKAPLHWAVLSEAASACID